MIKSIIAAALILCAAAQADDATLRGTLRASYTRPPPPIVIPSHIVWSYREPDMVQHGYLWVSYGGLWIRCHAPEATDEEMDFLWVIAGRKS